MLVWLVHIGELLPVDRPFRPFRYTWLAESLVRAGHRVVRWAPTFAHALKRQRYESDARVEVEPGYALELLYVRGYRRHVGIGRMRFNVQLAHRLWRRVREQDKPSLIVAAIPAPEVAWVAGEYGRARGVPVVVDIRDLWPDVLLQAIPARYRRVMQPTLFPWRCLNRRTLRHARGIVAVSQSYLDWGLRQAGRDAGPMDRVFPIGHPSREPERSPDAAESSPLAAAGVDPRHLVCCFAGQFEQSYDLETVIDAARRLWDAGVRDIQFVLCGHGGKAEALQARARGVGSVVFPGWVGPSELAAVMRQSQVGLACYAAGALQSVPNKVAEYLSAGLAVVSSLRGEFQSMLAEGSFGVDYTPGDAAMLAAVLVSLRDHPERLGELQRNAERFFTRRFRVSVIYPEMVRYLEAVGGA